MLSPLKLALVAIVSFATLAIATPALEARSQDPKTLISDANRRLETAVLPFCMCPPFLRLVQHIAHCLYIDFVTPTNATSDCFVPIIDEVVEIVGDLVGALEVSSLSGCDCTTQDILELIATTLEVLVIPLSTACLLRSHFRTADHSRIRWCCIRFKCGPNQSSRWSCVRNFLSHFSECF